MKSYAFVGGFVLDGNEDMTPERKDILVKDGRIEDIRITPDDTAEAISAYTEDGYEIVDISGKYIMPGLINLHVHIPGSGKPQNKPMDTKKLVKLATANAVTKKFSELMIYKNYAEMELLSGVTTIRSVGGILNFDTKTRDSIASGKWQGPRVLASNMAVSVPGGHMAGSLAYEATSPEEAVKFVELIAKDKPDLIKLMITGGVLDATVKGEPGVLKMPPEVVKAACDKAHELGFAVAAHVESPEGVRVALQNGVDTIEHGAEPDEEILDLFKERGAALVTTISPALPYAFFDRNISHVTDMEQYNGRVVFDGIINCAKACIEDGIPVGLGTDTGCPYVTHYNMWRELYFFRKFCGVTNSFALYTATKRNAQIAHIDDITGSVEVGKCADLIVTEKNPLSDLEALRDVTMVVTCGKLIREPKVKKMDNVDRELDKF